MQLIFGVHVGHLRCFIECENRFDFQVGASTLLESYATIFLDF